ncbi:MAG: radical SAM protein [Gammaproteobacteria bacterium]
MVNKSDLVKASIKYAPMASQRLVSGAINQIKRETDMLKPKWLWLEITELCNSRCSYCLPPSEIILGDNLPISQLQIDNSVASPNGLVKVKDMTDRDYNGKLIKIHALGLLPFEVTPEHPLLIAHSKTKRHYHMENIKFSAITGKYNKLRNPMQYTEINYSIPAWKEAKDIKTKNYHTDGDYLCLPMVKRNISLDKISLINFLKVYKDKKRMYKNDKTNRSLAIAKGRGASLEFPLNEDTAWLLGIYVAEGCPSYNGAKFVFNINETELHEKVRKISKTQLGYSVTQTKIEKRNGMELNINSLIIKRAFAEWCGKGASKKKMPDFILFNKDDKILKAFLLGWEQGDGYFNRKDKKFSGTTVSRILATQLQLAYCALGISANICHIPLEKRLIHAQRSISKGNLKIIPKHDVFHVEYYVNNKRYIKIIGQYMLRPIRRIEERDYTGKVYNIETEDNQYLVSNAVVHNCSIWKNKRVEQPLSPEELKRILSDPVFKDVEYIINSGGESTTRPDLTECLLAEHEALPNARINISTNGLMPERALNTTKALLEKGVSVEVGVSLDGVGEHHDTSRGVKGNFEKVDFLLHQLVELRKTYKDKLMVTTGTVLIDDTIPFIPELREYAEKINVSTTIQWYNSTPYYHNEGTDREHQKEILKKIVSSLPKNILNEKWVNWLDGKSIRFKCFSLFDFCVIRSNGDIAPCLTHWEVKAGNLRKNTATELWTDKNPQMQESRKIVRGCAGCVNSWGLGWSAKSSFTPIASYYLRNPDALVEKMKNEEASKKAIDNLIDIPVGVG